MTETEREEQKKDKTDKVKCYDNQDVKEDLEDKVKDPAEEDGTPP